MSFDIREFAKLPRSQENFTALRRNGKIYVDKTAMIYDLAFTEDKYFISRPRRFGKTLLISTLESLFRYGLRDFKGLAIEKLWHDHTYPVIHLDFSNCNVKDSFDEFKHDFQRMVKDAVTAAGLTFPAKDPDDHDSTAARFGRLLQQESLPFLVLLIDEYDAPLNSCMHDRELFAKVHAQLQLFFSVIKAHGGKFRFLFMTGICKYRNLDIFSGNNNITDVSLYTDFGTLLGYTDEEVRHYFSPFVENAATVLGISFEECISRLKQHYDGFCFDEKASSHVFAPWSVLSFLRNPARGFKNYWYDSGGQSAVLLNYIKNHSLLSPEEYGKDQYVSFEDLDSSQKLEVINPQVLLTMAGYLTIKKADPDGDLFTVNYPNEEVRTSIRRLYADKIFTKAPKYVIGMSALALFSQESPEQIVLLLNQVFEKIDYARYPIKDEASLRGYLQMYVEGGGIDTVTEKHNAYGRSDLEFVAQKRYVVIELKFSKDADDEELLLKKAVTQIKEKHYGEQSHPELEHIRMALVFSKDKRQFVKNCFC